LKICKWELGRGWWGGGRAVGGVTTSGGRDGRKKSPSARRNHRYLITTWRGGGEWGEEGGREDTVNRESLGPGGKLRRKENTLYRGKRVSSSSLHAQRDQARQLSHPSTVKRRGDSVLSFINWVSRRGEPHTTNKGRGTAPSKYMLAS